MSELKPCPFCGGKPTAIETHPGRGELYCGTCDVVLGGNNAMTPEELTAAWNTRHVETCTVERNESGCNFAYRLWTLSCGHTVWTMGDAPNYCPTCGRKVEL